MIKVVLVDDEPRLRRAWETLFASQPDMTLLAALPQADTLAQVIAEKAPHVVVVDLTMPGIDPLEAIRAIATSHPSVRSVVYSAHSDTASLRSAYDAGAWGYLDKLAAPSEMFSVIRRVAGGEAVFPVDFAS